jgi:hypothetical protein
MTTSTYVLLSKDDNGNEVRQYDNGTIRNEKGQLLQLPERLESHLITSENTREYSTLRKQKILDAIEKGLQDVTKTRLPSDAIAAIVSRRAEIAMKDDTRIGNEAAKIVLQAVDAYQNRVQENVQTQRQEYSIDTETLAIIEQMIQNRRSNNGAIDAIVDKNNDENE